MKRNIIFIIGIIFTQIVFAQKARLEGVVIDQSSNHPLEFANVIIFNTTTGTVTDSLGRFNFSNLNAGYVRVQVSAIGYENIVSADILVTNARTAFIEIKVNPSTTELEEVSVKASPFTRKAESPVSMRTIGISEIEKSPGGNRDISKVLQSLPGVAGAASYRNDVIVRGGGPSENRFYLDGVEIPTINHFATQGASGGPVGIINVDFIREVEFYSGAFPADRGNSLSSVLEFSQVDGNKEKMKYRATVGASDLALTVDGPVAKNTTLVSSVRRSYLQFLFAALELPFLPTYNDFQFKTKTRFNQHNELTLIGLGAIDQFDLNRDANKTEYQRYILGYLPAYEQWNYTVGGVYKHFSDHGYETFVVSRSHMNNTSYKYFENIEVDSLKTLDYKSDEIENKLRFEKYKISSNNFKVNYGAGLEYSQYYNRTFQKIYLSDQPINLNYKTDLGIVKWNLFGQVSRGIFDEALILSLGVRADANNYSSQMNNLFKQISPRFSASFPFADRWSWNFNTGRYYQLPAYTTLGFADNNGTLVNKSNKIKYIESDHWVTGLEFQPDNESKITLEGFYKIYHKYPFSINDSVAIASKGGDYGTFGDEAVNSTGKGRSYGIEFYIRQTDLWGINTLLSYTWVRSEFEDIYGNYIPTAWDNKHLLNITASKKFKNNWDVGFKFRFAGGSPYTPDNIEKSAYVLAWNARGRAYPDYSKFNSKRLKATNQLDIRVDKSYFFNKWSLMLYVDVQNVLASKTYGADILTNLDENGQSHIINPTDDISQQKYDLRYLKNDNSGTAIPTVGIMVEF